MAGLRMVIHSLISMVIQLGMQANHILMMMAMAHIRLQAIFVLVMMTSILFMGPGLIIGITEQMLTGICCLTCLLLCGLRLVAHILTHTVQIIRTIDRYSVFTMTPALWMGPAALVALHIVILNLKAQ